MATALTPASESVVTENQPIKDPAKLKKRRMYALSSHTKTVGRIEEALRAKNETRILEGRMRLVQVFEELESRQSAYLSLSFLTTLF